MKLKESTRSSLVFWILVGGVIEAFMLLLGIPAFTQLFPELYNIDRFPDGYDRLASNLVAGHGYKFFPDTAETLMRAPGYPLLLAMVFYFFSYSLVAVQIVNLTLALITAWIVAMITRRFTSSKIALVLASFSFLVHPAIILSQSRGGVESLFCLLIAGFVLALCKAFDRQKLLDYVVAGLLLGLATTVKSTPLLFPAFVFGCLLLTRKWNSIVTFWLPRLALMGGVMLVVLLPWIVRNYSLVKQFVPTMTVAGTSASHGLYTCKKFSLDANTGEQFREASRQLEAVAAKLNLPHRGKFFQYFYEAKDEVRFNQYLLTTVFDEYRKSPALLVQCSLQNVFNFWFTGRTWESTVLNMLAQAPYLILSAIGVYFCTRRGYLKQMFPILSFAAYFLIVHLPIIALARYSVPLIPILTIFCGIAIDELRMKWLTRSSS